MEEYFTADRLLELKMGSVVQVCREDNDMHFTVSLVGVDNGKSIVTSLPPKLSLPEGSRFVEIFSKDTMLEMKTIHDGRVVAFESAVQGMYRDDLLIGTFPEMIETRRLRKDIRLPCALSCDIRWMDHESYGVITNISHGGCQISVPKDNEYAFIEELVNTHKTLDLEIFFPIAEEPVIIGGTVKSSDCQVDGACKLGLAFTGQYESVRRYLESLQLDSVAPFFF